MEKAAGVQYHCYHCCCFFCTACRVSSANPVSALHCQIATPLAGTMHQLSNIHACNVRVATTHQVDWGFDKNLNSQLQSQLHLLTLLKGFGNGPSLLVHSLERQVLTVMLGR
eukprot:GHRR01012245.1.p3 GENE.GHRR01012245.1~~GHRR01012245.1.p3  ORF type:complete len:112 (-),score=16.84 GHRR01012245.1:3334-3669(-)